MNSFSKWSVLDQEYFDPELGEKRRVFDPHPAQLEIMESPARMKIAVCGRRMGKSNIGGNELIPEAVRAYKNQRYLKTRGQRMEFWIVGPQYSDAEKEFRVFYDKAKRLGMEFDRPGTYYSVQTGDMVVSLWGGAFIVQAKSEARPSSLVGEALSGVIMAECAKMKEITWTQLIRPTLADFDGWALFTTTPEGKNWIYRLYLDAIAENNRGWTGFRLPSWRNPHVFKQETSDKDVKLMMQTMNEHPELSSFQIIESLQLKVDPEIAQMANDLTIPMFQQEVAAEFTDFVGKVFKEFDEETHSRLLPFNPAWETVAAVDYGYRNPNVWLLIQIGPWGEINIIDELYQDNLAPDEFAQEILRRDLCPDACTEFYPDPASPGDTKVLESIFRRAGKRAIARPGTGGELNSRLNLIRLALKQRIADTERNKKQHQEFPPKPDLQRPRLMISSKCTMALYEFGEYRYPEKRHEQAETSVKRFELPMKKDDHTIEALGRMMAGKYHSAASQYGGGTRISNARFLNGLGGKYLRDPAGVGQERNGRVRPSWISQ